MIVEERRLIRTEIKDNVGTIAFDDYAKRNALSCALSEQVIAALTEFDRQGVRCIILRAAENNKVWSAGHDVEELPKADVDPLPYNDPMERLFRAVKHHDCPVIAMVHGQVWGGACELVLSCDLVYGDETCAFAITPAKLGLPYNVAGLLTFVNRLPLAVVKEMFYTADLIGAKRAERLGLVNEVVPSAELESYTHDVARTICTRSADAIRGFKEALRIISESVAISPTTYEYLHGIRQDIYFGKDYHEGIRAFLEKRAPKFE